MPKLTVGGSADSNDARVSANGTPLCHFRLGLCSNTKTGWLGYKYCSRPAQKKSEFCWQHSRPGQWQFVWDKKSLREARKKYG